MDDLIISIPASWRRSSDPACGVLVAARATALPPSGVRPRLSLRCEPVPGGSDRWRADTLTELAAGTVAFDLEDEDTYDIGGHEVAYRRYAHLARGADLLCDEWSWHVDGVGFVLTGTTAREDYPDYCDVFEAVAETFEPCGEDPVPKTG